MGLRWSAWMPLMAAHPLALAQLPSDAGLYRLRRAGRPGQVLAVFASEHGVRETVERLSRQAHLPLEPYDDPTAPARLLWNGRRSGLQFEVSGACLAANEDGQRWAECLTTLALTFS